MKRVDPPDKTTLEKSIRRRSMSDFRIEYASTSCIPSNSSPIKSGRNRTSGARNFAGPIYREKSFRAKTNVRHIGKLVLHVYETMQLDEIFEKLYIFWAIHISNPYTVLQVKKNCFIKNHAKLDLCIGSTTSQNQTINNYN